MLASCCYICMLLRIGISGIPFLPPNTWQQASSKNQPTNLHRCFFMAQIWGEGGKASLVSFILQTVGRSWWAYLTCWIKLVGNEVPRLLFFIHRQEKRSKGSLTQMWQGMCCCSRGKPSVSHGKCILPAVCNWVRQQQPAPHGIEWSRKLSPCRPFNFLVLPW
jgi:hypothetical protein